jgi:hypothetical protein
MAQSNVNTQMAYEDAPSPGGNTNPYGPASSPTGLPTSVAAPSAPAAASPSPSTGIINSAAAPTTAAAPAPAGPANPSLTTFSNYGDGKVATGDYEMGMLQSSADTFNKAAGTNMSAFDYDKMVNPTTYGARWNADGTAPGVGTPPAGTPSAPGTAGTASTGNMTAATIGNPTPWNVTGSQTVAGQITALMDPNSPLIQQARTQGLELANERGLVNSSIGETAAMNAAYTAAQPIAQADAATYSKAAGYNADQKNQAAMFNATATNQASQANLSAQTQQAIASLQAHTQTDLAYLDATTKTNLAALSNDNQVKLAQIEAQYHDQMQASQSASNLFSQITQNITNISASKDMDAAAKQAAVDNQLLLLRNGMSINGAISNLNLSDLLDFSGSTPVPPAPGDNGVGANYGGGLGGIINGAAAQVTG